MSAFATDFYLGFGFLYSLASGHFCFLDIFVFLLGYAKGQYKKYKYGDSLLEETLHFKNIKLLNCEPDNDLKIYKPLNCFKSVDQ